MDRDEFMELVYETFADEPDNVLANGIIEAADAYVEHEKEQLSKEGTTKDTISRQEAIDLVTDMEFMNFTAKGILRDSLRKLPPAQPEPKEGEWVQIQRCTGDAQPDLECPFCKHRIGWFDMGRYCAGCGAKLKGGSNE